MSFIEAISLAVIVLMALYLLALGGASMVVPARASRFLLGFASSRATHFAELFIRAIVGASLVLYAPRVSESNAFNLVGWLLLITTGFLFLVPWRWHQRFAQQAVPRAVRHIKLIGMASLAMGVLILMAVASGPAA